MPCKTASRPHHHLRMRRLSGTACSQKPRATNPDPGVIQSGNGNKTCRFERSLNDVRIKSPLARLLRPASKGKPVPF
eukprot:scaffold71431_cov34-Phaeocystis_antarctica.AAC.3